MEEAQIYLDRWEERWADTRIHGTTKRQVAAMFAEERPALLPLPLEPVPLLSIRRAHRTLGRLCRGRERLLWRASWLDWPPHPGLMEFVAGPPAGPCNRTTAARAPCGNPAARIASWNRISPGKLHRPHNSYCAGPIKPEPISQGPTGVGRWERSQRRTANRLLEVTSDISGYRAISGRRLARRRLPVPCIWAAASGTSSGWRLRGQVEYWTETRYGSHSGSRTPEHSRDDPSSPCQTSSLQSQSIQAIV